MAVRVQFKRRINGAAGSPAAAGALEGELALNFPNAPGSTEKPIVWAFDGSAWREVNPNTAITTQTEDLNTPGGADIGAAYTAWIAIPGNTLTGDIVIATYGNPAQAYVLTKRNQPAVAGSWTSLGGSTPFATGPEIAAGTLATAAISPAGLRGEALNAPSTGTAAAADANKLIRLNAQGQIDNGFLQFSALTYRGNVDVTAAYTAPSPAWNPGDFATVQKTGTADASWNAHGITGPMNAGDLIIFDGTNYHAVAQETDLSAYLPLAGGTMTAPAAIVFDVPAGAGTTVRLNGTDNTKSSIDNFTLDAGTY